MLIVQKKFYNVCLSMLFITLHLRAERVGPATHIDNIYKIYIEKKKNYIIKVVYSESSSIRKYFI